MIRRSGNAIVSTLTLICVVAVASTMCFSRLGDAARAGIAGRALAAQQLVPAVGSSTSAAVATAGKVAKSFVRGGYTMADELVTVAGDVLSRARLQSQLSDDLLAPAYRAVVRAQRADGGSPHATFGHCYVACETAYHLVGGAASDWKPVRKRISPEIVHWWLENKKTGEIFDPTFEQFDQVVPYAEGTGGGFLTVEASARAKELMARVRGENNRTLQSYEQHLSKYAAGTPPKVSDSSAKWIAATLERIRGERKLLEIGSGLGRDADFMEAQGFSVLRSDAARSFVQHLLSQGHDAKLINVATDDIAQKVGKQNAIFANAVLLHFPESELRATFDNIRKGLTEEGVLAFTVKRGQGEEWTDAKLGSPRYFRYWEADELYPVLQEHGFDVEWDLVEGNWLHVVARRTGE